MKNFFKFLGVISLALIIGFSMAACNPDDDGDDDSGGGGTGLTIQNIPSSVTGYVMCRVAYSPSLRLIANDTFVNNASVKAAAIADGKATLNAFIYSTGAKLTGTQTYPDFNEGANSKTLSIWVVSSETPCDSSGNPTSVTASYTLKTGKTLQFTNGKAVLDWADVEVE
jgi:hypothetical protein